MKSFTLTPLLIFLAPLVLASPLSTPNIHPTPFPLPSFTDPGYPAEPTKLPPSRLCTKICADKPPTNCGKGWEPYRFPGSRCWACCKVEKEGEE